MLATSLAVGALLAAPGLRPAGAAQLLVTSLADEVTPGNGCSLREAMANADADAQVHPDCAAGLGPDTIHFAESGTIALTLGPLPTITSVAGLVIDGGPELVTISGGGRFRHFVVQPDEPRDAGWDLTLRFLVLVDGKAPDGQPGFNTCGEPGHVGGSIVNFGTLLLRGVRITGARAGGGGGSNIGCSGIGGNGGAIANLGPAAILVAEAAVFDANRAGRGGGNPNNLREADAGSGGAIHNGGGIVWLANTTFFDNDAPRNPGGRNGAGGAIHTTGGRVVVIYSTFRRNDAYPEVGSGVYSAGGEVAFFATVMANDGNNCGAGPGGHLTNIGYNLEDRSTCGFTGNQSLSNQENPHANPPIDNLKLASSLASNGGSLPSLALGSGSVAIDHVPFVVHEPVGLINCAELAVVSDDLPLDEPLAIDGRLLPRPAKTGQACDAGAFEFRPSSGLSSPPGSPKPVSPCHGEGGQGSRWGNGRCSPWRSGASD